MAAKGDRRVRKRSCNEGQDVPQDSCETKQTGPKGLNE
jgi:hypothetical protein